MQVSGLHRVPYLGFGATGSAPAAATVRGAPADGRNWLTVQKTAKDLELAVIDLRRLLTRIRPKDGAGVAATTGTNDLNLDPTSKKAAKRSVEEVNNTQVTFTPTEPEWAGASTTQLHVTGTYDLSDGDPEAYTFTVQKTDNGNPNKANKIRIEDSLGKKLEDLNVYQADLGVTTFTLKNGLEVRFDAGAFVKDDTLTLTASSAFGASVNPNNPFDGRGSLYPDLEEGTTVTAGSFTVNGTNIIVNANDSINDVLARITANTDVNATFDVTTETVVLERKVIGDLPIDLANDTSGFLAAVKLDTAALEPGWVPDADDLMINVPQFSGVSAGTIQINGTGIAIDPALDTLNDVIARINASAADVTATLVDNSFLHVTNNISGPDLIFDDNGTGFLATFGIADGAIEAEGASRGRGLHAALARKVAKAVFEVGDLAAELLSITADGTVLKAALKSFGTAARSTLAKAFGADEDASRLRISGLTVDMADDSKHLFASKTADERSFTKAITRDYVSFRDAMLKDLSGSDQNYLEQLEDLASGLFTRSRSNIDLTL